VHQQVPTDSHDQTQRVVAALVAGWSTREIAEAEGVTTRRIPQVIHVALKQREANPGRDFRPLQMARLEQAIETIGAQIDAGDLRSIYAYFIALDRLVKLGWREFHLSAECFRSPGDVEAIEGRFRRLDAARELVATTRKRRRAGETEAAPPVTAKPPGGRKAAGSVAEVADHGKAGADPIDERC